MDEAVVIRRKILRWAGPIWALTVVLSTAMAVSLAILGNPHHS
ncbi:MULTISPECIES: hypothetical protein [Streptomyces]|nr:MULTISPECIES: hypothetical protein [Streptomyces]